MTQTTDDQRVSLEPTDSQILDFGYSNIDVQSYVLQSLEVCALNLQPTTVGALAAYFQMAGGLLAHLPEKTESEALTEEREKLKHAWREAMNSVARQLRTAKDAAAQKDHLPLLREASSRAWQQLARISEVTEEPRVDDTVAERTAPSEREARDQRQLDKIATGEEESPKDR
jgi:hypothetical protein